MIAQMSLTTPTKQDAIALFHFLEQHFPSQTLGSEKWYILTIAAISSGGHPEFSADLYLHLISREAVSYTHLTLPTKRIV